MLRLFFNSLSSNAYLLLTLAALFWGGNFVVGRGMHEEIPPLAMATIRWNLAALLFLPFALKYLKRDWSVIVNNIPVLMALGLTSVGCFTTFAYIGLNHTTALNGLIIQSAGPILIILAALLMFGERFGLRQFMGVILSLIGVIVIVSEGSPTNIISLSFNKGDLWILAAMGIWALYTVLLRKRPNIHANSFLIVTFIIGALANIPFFIWEHLNVRQIQITGASLLTIAYISVFPSIIAYLFWNKGVALIGANRAGTFLHLAPLFGSVMAILFLGEQPHLFHALGFGMILVGVAIAVRP